MVHPIQNHRLRPSRRMRENTLPRLAGVRPDERGMPAKPPLAPLWPGPKTGTTQMALPDFISGARADAVEPILKCAARTVVVAPAKK